MAAKLIFLALLSTTQAQAPGCACERGFKPVCGSNGETYNTQCHLECEVGNDITVAYNGPCCPPPSCSAFTDHVCDSQGTTHENECWFRYSACIARRKDGVVLTIDSKGACEDSTRTDEAVLEALRDASNCTKDSCSDEFDPVCDTNGRTHRNQCLFKYADCLDRRAGSGGFEVANVGACGVEPNALCQTPCPSVLLPVCGDDGVTYNSTCHLSRTNCGADNNTLVSLAYFGSCMKDSVEPVTVVVPGMTELLPILLHSTDAQIHTTVSGTSQTPKPQRPSLDCVQSCGSEYKPVCGSDRQVYPNECRLDYASCVSLQQSGSVITVINEGPCESQPPGTEGHSSAERRRPVATESAEINEDGKSAVNTCVKDCGTDVSPVCDQNDNRYGNRCVFEVENCLQVEQGLPPLQELPCIEPSLDPTLSECDRKACGREFSPVCDDQGTTHANPCQLDRQNCKRLETGLPVLLTVYQGPCGAPTTKSTDTPNMKLVEKCTFQCAPVTAEICDNLNRTHRNPCEFDVASCIQNVQTGEPLQIAARHACGHDDRETIQLNIGGASNSLEAVCPFDCKDGFEPVCDSRGVTHPNQCTFLHSLCVEANTKPGLAVPSIVKYGECDRLSTTQRFTGSTARPTANPNVRVGAAFEEDFSSCKDRCDSREDAPVCDTRGATYPSMCAFEYAKCLTMEVKGIELRLSHTGACTTALPSIDATPAQFTKDTVPPPTTVTTLRPSTTHEQGNCEVECPNTADYVCDSQGTTHANLCIFNNANCKRIASGEAPLQPTALAQCTGTETEDLHRNDDSTLCVPHCTMVFDPVCGSDGKTYENICIFNHNACEKWHAEGQLLKIQRQGSCNLPERHPSSPDACSLRCEHSEPATICGTDGNTRTSLCEYNSAVCFTRQTLQTDLDIAHFSACTGDETLPADCPTEQCADDENALPLCDENFVTYASLCEFKKASCAARQQTGFGLLLQDFGACRLTLSDQDFDTCSFVCGSQIDPVCDSLGQTHNNLCMFKAEQCLRNRNHEEAALLIHFEECVPDIDYSAIETCTASCSDDVDPVCSQDGVTHKNMCDFNYNSCLNLNATGHRLDVAHRGKCKGRHQQTTTAPSTYDCVEDCPEHEEAYSFCDNLNQTHSSICRYRYFSCLYERSTSEPLLVNHAGECTGLSRAFTQDTESCDASDCIVDETPVCATNGESFENLCELRRRDCGIRREGGIALQLKHKGRCMVRRDDGGVGLLIELNSQPEVAACNPDCADGGYDPICDTDGTTHVNPCMFRYASCALRMRAGAELQIAYVGMCSAEHAVQPAPLDGQSIDNRPEVISSKYENCDSMPCVAASGISVCGSNFQTYRSQCEFQRASCRSEISTGQQLQVLHYGPCPNDEPCQVYKDCSGARPETVCDTLGHQYRSRCEFERNKCLMDLEGLDITLTPCRQPTSTQVPVELPTTSVQPVATEPSPVVIVQDFTSVTASTEPSTQLPTEGSTQPSTQVPTVGSTQPSTQLPTIVSTQPSTQLPTHGSTQLVTLQSIPPPTLQSTASTLPPTAYPSTAASTTHCEPSCDLSENAPVCASDGQTYGNQCLLQQAACLYEDPTLSVVSLGSCSCERDCGTERDPICDSRGVTYANKCLFEMDACMMMKKIQIEIHIAYAGECGTQELLAETSAFKASASRDSIIAEQNLVTADEDCPESCPKPANIEATVCSSKQILFPSKCHMKQYACRSNEKVSSNRQARCCDSAVPACNDNTYEPMCDDHGNTHMNLCHFAGAQCNEYSKSGSVLSIAYKGACCNRECPLDFDPVCSSNGETYMNMCWFTVAQCEARKMHDKIITLDYSGLCREFACDENLITTCEPTPVCGTDENTYSSRCELSLAQCIAGHHGISLAEEHDGACCDTACPYSYEPVCDSQGRTHVNECVFKVHKCETRMAALAVVRRGPCCDGVCSEEYEPVCGTDGVTYENMCYLKSAQCTAAYSNTTVSVLHPGPCCDLTGCSKEGAVCGTDGQSYKTECALRTANCKSGGTAQVAYTGKCCALQDCPADKRQPVCDSQGITHASVCAFEHQRCIQSRAGQELSDVEYNGACCEFRADCRTTESTTVCDQHGRSYANRCEFDFAACRTRRIDGHSLLATQCAKRVLLT